MSPSVSPSKEAIKFSSVDFPDPDSPIIATNSPAPTDKFI
ncbi:Uncharacterised protein [Staphylococcus aureus]|nr:Uncharacterised protein [Staphylococcus aureus]